MIGVPVCLPDTFRSQRFSRSQRLAPTWALWLCFTPHPPLGFRPSELSSTRTSRSISRCPPALLPLVPAPNQYRYQLSALAFRVSYPPASQSRPESLTTTQRPDSRTTSSVIPASKPASTTARGHTKTRSGAEQSLRPRPSSQNGQDAPLPTSVGPGFRALLRPSVRTLCLVFSQLQGRCSPDLPLSEANTHHRWTCVLPS